MRAFFRVLSLAVFASFLTAIVPGCGDDSSTDDMDMGDGGADGSVGDGDGDGDATGDGDGDTSGDGDGDGDDMSIDPLLDAPEAVEAGSLELDADLGEVVHVSDLALGLHTESGVSILDLSDPAEPGVHSKLDTTGRAIGVAYDSQRAILFIITVSGDLRAYRVADVTAPVMAAQALIPDPGADADSIRGIVRIGLRLFLLGQSQLLPVEIRFGANDTISLIAEAAVAIDGSPVRIAAGGGAIYVALTGGDVQVWSGGASPSLQGSAELGGDITGWVVRGRRLFVALSGVGLRVLDMADPSAPEMLFDAPEFDDLSALQRFGNLVLLALERGMLVALDLSVLEAPRPLVTRAGSLPDWIAPAGGNLLLGSGRNLSVFGVPPFVASSVPGIARRAFPRYGRIPFQLSKAIDASTVSTETVSLTCGGEEVAGTVTVSFDNRTLTFMPTASLPAGLDCSLDFDGVQDALGADLTGNADSMAITTADAAPEPVMNNASSYAHTADGKLTDWEEGKTDGFEYFDVTAARGMYSHFYADYDGTRLWMLNDWYYNGDDIDPDCYNQFGVWTGGGAQQWNIRAYGDQRIEVRLNGQLLDDGDERVTGGYALTGTPNDPEEHTVYELSIATEAGAWGVQLHDPGPTYGCDRLETDPTTYNGSSTAESSMIDPTTVPTTPMKPTPSGGSGTIASLTPSLLWPTEDSAGNWTVYILEIWSGDGTGGARIYRRLVYGTQWGLPAGLLQNGNTYTWRVTAYNLAGVTQGDPVTFTVNTGDSVSAPTLSSVTPDTIDQGGFATLTLTGTGFVQGARVYFNGTQITTTYVSDTQLMAMVDDSLTQTNGAYDVVVRNDPSDESTESSARTVTVQTAPAACVHSECLPGARLASACSSCATAICNSNSDCCDVSWDAACVAAANSSQSCSCSAPTLVSIDNTEIGANVSTSINATMTNAPAGVYNMVLTPSGGGQETVIFCDWTGTNVCEAFVSIAAGTYDVTIRVGQSPSFDTNTLTGALVASAPAACAHSECMPGAALVDDCNFCVTGVCDSDATCCSSEWGQSCVDIALGHGNCGGCSAPGIDSLSQTSMTEGDTPSVTATLTNAPDDTYALVFTPAGGGSETVFSCTWATGPECAANVSGLSADTYDVVLRVGDTVTWDSPVFGTQFTVNSSGGGGTCGAPTCMDLGGGDCRCDTGGGYYMLCQFGQCECRTDADQIYNDGPIDCSSIAAMETSWANMCETGCVE